MAGKEMRQNGLDRAMEMDRDGKAAAQVERDGPRGAAARSAYPPGGCRRGPVLTGEQERVLLEHLPIVRFLARRIHERLPQHVDIEDLVSAGVVGLMDAFAKFDPAKKVQFRSYAQFRIRGAILDSLRTLDWSPRELRRKGRAVEEAIRVLTARMGHAPGEARGGRRDGAGAGGVPAVARRPEGPGDRHPAHGAQRGLGRGGAGLCARPSRGRSALPLPAGRARGAADGCHRQAARPGAAGDDPLLLRRDDHARDRPGAGGGRVAGLPGPCLGGGASAGPRSRIWPRAASLTAPVAQAARGAARRRGSGGGIRRAVRAGQRKKKTAAGKQ